MYKGTLARLWAMACSMSLSALSFIGLCQIWPSNPQYVMFWYWLLYFSNMILNTLHHVICCHLSTRYCAYLKMLANFKSHGTMYSKLGYWNKATSKCTTSNFYTIKNPLFGHIWLIFHLCSLGNKKVVQMLDLFNQAYTRKGSFVNWTQFWYIWEKEARFTAEIKKLDYF